MDKCMSQPVARRRATAPSTREFQLTPTSLWSYSLGGLAGRYRGHYKDVRLVDPWSGQVLRFRTQAHADNWLLRAFDPNCISYCSRPEPLHTLIRGRLIKVTPSGAGRLLGGDFFVDVVVRENYAADEQLWNDVRESSACRSITAVRRSLSDLRGNSVLLDNLERMRSHLVQHVAVAPAATCTAPAILRVVQQQGTCTWGDVLRSATAPCSTEVAEFALYLAYRRGELHVDVHEKPLGTSSLVTLRPEVDTKTRPHAASAPPESAMHSRPQPRSGWRELQEAQSRAAARARLERVLCKVDLDERAFRPAWPALAEEDCE